MSAPALSFGSPAAKWEVSLVSSQQRFSALSAADVVVVNVKAFQGGQPVNPTTGTGQLAFKSTPLAQPVSGDWKTASWDTNEIGEYVLEATIGSSGAITLTPGVWYVWAQVTLSPIEVVRQVGSIVVY